MKQTNSFSIETIRNALAYVDGFANPKKIEEESEKLLSVTPEGSALWGEIKYYIKIHKESIEVFTSTIFKELELSHRFFSEIKRSCIERRIGFNSDIDKGVTLSFKQKILTGKDIQIFILRVYDLGKILSESNYIFKNQPDLVRKFYKQVFLRIGPYEKSVILDKDADTFIRGQPFSGEFVTVPDKDGFFEILLGNALTITERETAHESIPPYVLLLGRDTKPGGIFLPWAVIDWNKMEKPPYVPTVWDGSCVGKLRGLTWKNISAIELGIKRIIDVLNSIKEDNKELPDAIYNPIEYAANRLERFKDNEYLFLTLKNNKFESVLDQIRDIIEYLLLCWNVNTKNLTWKRFEEIPVLGDFLTSKQELEIRNTATDMYKSTYEIQVGLRWAERFLNKIVLWLASTHVKEKIRAQNLYSSSIDEKDAFLANSKRKLITADDIMKMGNIELRDFVSGIFEKARFICPDCKNDTLLQLIIYKTQQGFIFSCPICNSRFLCHDLSLETTITHNIFVIDTSAIIEGITSELVTQSILDKPSYVVPRAVEFELQRLRKSEGRKKGKKGLSELIKLRELDDEGRILLRIDGNLPSKEITIISKEWKVGLDAMIIEMAKKYSGTIITCDNEDLAPLASAEGIRTLVYKAR